MYCQFSLFNSGASLKVLIFICVGAVSSSTELRPRGSTGHAQFHRPVFPRRPGGQSVPVLQGTACRHHPQTCAVGCGLGESQG